MEFQQLVRFRRSIRRFAALPVEKETLEKLVDAARYAPSADFTRPSAPDARRSRAGCIGWDIPDRRCARCTIAV